MVLISFRKIKIIYTHTYLLLKLSYSIINFFNAASSRTLLFIIRKTSFPNSLVDTLAIPSAEGTYFVAIELS